MNPRRSVLLAALPACAALVVRVGHAQPTQKLDTQPGSEGAMKDAVSKVVKSEPAPPAADYGYWSRGNARWFLSTRSELGAPYVKPYFSAGYGLPHWFWFGADVNAILTTEFVQGYAGLRASSPLLDLAFGWRDTQSFGKVFLDPKTSYVREDVLDARLEPARYWAWEAEAVAILPLPYAALVGNFVAVHPIDVPAGKLLYDESYRAIVDDGTFAVVRAVAVARILREDALKVGVLSEFIFGAGRGKAVTRLGPVLALQITDHLEALGVVSLAVSSPDQLGLTLGTYAVCGLRYRWATGEADPKLPWSGQVIP